MRIHHGCMSLEDVGEERRCECRVILIFNGSRIILKTWRRLRGSGDLCGVIRWRWIGIIHLCESIRFSSDTEEHNRNKLEFNGAKNAQGKGARTIYVVYEL
jgi:hypothetical protein